MPDGSYRRLSHRDKWLGIGGQQYSKLRIKNEELRIGLTPQSLSVNEGSSQGNNVTNELFKKARAEIVNLK